MTALSSCGPAAALCMPPSWTGCSECHTHGDAEATWRPHYPHESGWRQTAVSKRDRNISCIEGILQPRFDKRIPAAHAGSKVRQRIRFLPLGVGVIVLEATVEPHLAASIERNGRGQDA